MESFCLWYKYNDGAGEKSVENDDDTKHPLFDLHANFWSENIKVKDSSGPHVPYLDIGIRIRDWENINKIAFCCPFILKKEDITDLTSKLKVQEIDELIFNDTCQLITGSDYTTITIGNTEQSILLLCPISFNDGDNGIKKNVKLGNSYLNSSEEKESFIEIDLSNIAKKYLGERDETTNNPNFNSIYFRFRIASHELENNIYFDSTPVNKSIESAFTNTRIIDFKINEERNLGHFTKNNITIGELHLAEFNAVHFLVMVPSHYDVQFLPNSDLSCRELEQRRWDDYFGKKIDTDHDHVLAYHCKKKVKTNQENNRKNFIEFSSLIKIKSYETNIKIIVSYMLIVIALGMLGSSLVNLISKLCISKLKFSGYLPDSVTILVGIILLLIVSLTGRK